jgi:hypothetical protein
VHLPDEVEIGRTERMNEIKVRSMWRIKEKRTEEGIKKGMKK